MVSKGPMPLAHNQGCRDLVTVTRTTPGCLSPAGCLYMAHARDSTRQAANKLQPDTSKLSPIRHEIGQTVFDSYLEEAFEHIGQGEVWPQLLICDVVLGLP